MASVVPRSIRVKLMTAIICLCVTPLAFSQHPGRVVVPPPPIHRVPVAPPPMFQPPIYRAPVSAPRIFAPATSATGNLTFHPPYRPIRPFPPAFVVYVFPPAFANPFWGYNSCLWAACDFFSAWDLGYSTTSYGSGPISYVPTQSYEPPEYGEGRSDLPELFLKDGTVLNVTDYWRVGEELHFKMIEAEGANPVEHEIPFDELDLQKTMDVNKQRGFRFMLREEPVEQYLLHHPELTIQPEP